MTSINVKSVPVCVLNRSHSTLVLSVSSGLDASALIVSHQLALQFALCISRTDEGDFFAVSLMNCQLYSEIDR